MTRLSKLVSQPLELVTQAVALLLELAAQHRIGRIGHAWMLLPYPSIRALVLGELPPGAGVRQVVDGPQALG